MKIRHIRNRNSVALMVLVLTVSVVVEQLCLKRGTLTLMCGYTDEDNGRGPLT